MDRYNTGTPQEMYSDERSMYSEKEWDEQQKFGCLFYFIYVIIVLIFGGVLLWILL